MRCRRWTVIVATNSLLFLSGCGDGADDGSSSAGGTAGGSGSGTGGGGTSGGVGTGMGTGGPASKGYAKIPAGTFMIGSPPDEEGRQDEETQHEVTITRPFELKKTEVTQGQWEELMGAILRIPTGTGRTLRW